MLAGCGVTLFNNPSLQSSRQLAGSLENSRTGVPRRCTGGAVIAAQNTKKSLSTLEEEVTARMGCPANITKLRYMGREASKDAHRHMGALLNPYPLSLLLPPNWKLPQVLFI